MRFALSFIKFFIFWSSSSSSKSSLSSWPDSESSSSLYLNTDDLICLYLAFMLPVGSSVLKSSSSSYVNTDDLIFLSSAFMLPVCSSVSKSSFSLYVNTDDLIFLSSVVSSFSSWLCSNSLTCNYKFSVRCSKTMKNQTFHTIDFFFLTTHNIWKHL